MRVADLDDVSGSRCDIWRVRGPPGELDDFGDAEPQVHADAIDEEYEEIGMRPFLDDDEVLAKAA